MTFIVADLDAMEQILQQVFGARRVYASGSETFSIAEERFFTLGADAIWIAIMKGEALPTRSYNHVAFKIEDADFDHYRRRIDALGLDLRESRPRIAGEGRSLYFHDLDNHLFELHTGTLPERLVSYAAIRKSETLSQETAPNP
jgi:catechol 2,3-dioxygenase-like lactoylglutathione lyase family enzyme